MAEDQQGDWEEPVHEPAAAAADNRMQVAVAERTRYSRRRVALQRART